MSHSYDQNKCAYSIAWCRPVQQAAACSFLWQKHQPTSSETSRLQVQNKRTNGSSSSLPDAVCARSFMGSESLWLNKLKKAAFSCCYRDNPHCPRNTGSSTTPLSSSAATETRSNSHCQRALWVFLPAFEVGEPYPSARSWGLCILLSIALHVSWDWDKACNTCWLGGQGNLSKI